MCPNPFLWAKKKLFFDGKSREPLTLTQLGSNSQRLNNNNIYLNTIKNLCGADVVAYLIVKT